MTIYVPDGASKVNEITADPRGGLFSMRGHTFDLIRLCIAVRYFFRWLLPSPLKLRQDAETTVPEIGGFIRS